MDLAADEFFPQSVLGSLQAAILDALVVLTGLTYSKNRPNKVPAAYQITLSLYSKRAQDMLW
eukprot:scaffold660707_cov53-Prasinocladus_malaysianus.AAC.1